MYVEIVQVFNGYALLQYGTVQAWGRQAPGAERGAFPAGEGAPPVEYWLDQLSACSSPEEAQQVVERAREELEAWRRRPDPPPPGETFDDLKARILTEGQGWSAKEVALAMRCTPTLVRNVRTEAERDPEYGRPDRSLAHALRLLDGGMSLRQVAQMTGIPKSTLHDARKAV